MQTIGATEARANFAALLRKAADAKERIVIERRGKPRAVMVPIEDLAAIEGGGAPALPESGQRLMDFADASSDWFWEMDENCRFIYFSERFTEVTGVPHEALLGKTREETGLPEVDPDTWRKHLADLAAHRSFRDFQHPRTLPDGRVVQLSVNGKAIFDEGGDFRGYRGTGTDITDQTRAAEDLRQSEARLRAIMDHAPMEIFLKDAEGRYAEINRRYEEMWGITNEEIKGKLPIDIHREEHAKASRARDLAVLESGRVMAREVVTVFDDGERDQHMIKFPVMDADGCVAGLGGIVIDITDRKRAEAALREARDELELRVDERTAELREANEALRQSEEQHRLITDNVPVMIAYFDPEHRYQFANKTCETWYGLSRADIVGRKLKEILKSEYEKIRPRIDIALSGKEITFEQSIKHPDGVTRNVHSAYVPHFDQSGRVRGCFVLVQDITERKRAESALRESEEMFSKVFQASPGLFAISKPEDGSHYDVNETWIKVLGYSREEALSHSALELGVWADPRDRARFVDRLRKDRSVRGFEAKFRTKSGDTLDFLVSGEYAEVGGEPQLLVVSQDITELKKSEQELRESEERFRSIVENSPSVITLKDIEGRFRLVNSRFEDRHQVSAADVIGKTTHDVYPPEFADAMESLDKEVIVSGAVCERELDLTFNDGSLRTVVVNKFPVPDAEGKVIGVGTISTDVTEHRLAEEQLRQAHRMEAVGQLTGGVAHDFNNLLAVIMGNAELLGERLGADDELVESIMRAASRGADLTQRLLAFSRRQPLRPRATDLRELVDGMGELLRRTLGETIKIEIMAPPDPCLVQIDPGQLENAVLNLAINARDAMPTGGRLDIKSAEATRSDDYFSTHPNLDPDHYIVLEISDTGTGMAPDVMARAVEPFFTTKDVGEGTGLGLSMVHGFAMQSGGELVILSEEGRGTTTKLYLPRASGEVDPAAARIAVDAKGGKGETVLVVEDDSDVRELAKTALESLGYRVRTAADAQAGLAALEAAPRIDLLFSDVVLPGAMSGPELAREATRRFPDLKVLFMSGYVEGALHAGTSLRDDADLLTKPFRKRDLARRVRAVLDR